MHQMGLPMIEGISPFFVVTDVSRSIAFYRDKLGFTVTFQDPSEQPFAAILCRDRAQIFVKSEAGIVPVPNSSRHRHLRWEAYLYVPNPDDLANEFRERGVSIAKALADTVDGLRGFELGDPDGYTLFFGRPR